MKPRPGILRNKANKEKKKQTRCWKGYEPVPGKKAYSEDSCRPVNSKSKRKTQS